MLATPGPDGEAICGRLLDAARRAGAEAADALWAELAASAAEYLRTVRAIQDADAAYLRLVLQLELHLLRLRVEMDLQV